MDMTYKQEVGVGAMVLIGVAVFLIGMFWLTGRSIGTSGATVDVAFESVAGLKVGDAVLVSGVRKGRVGGVQLERPGRVIVTLELERDVRPRIDATASVASLDFFGAKVINYTPGVREEPLAQGRVIAGSNETGLTDVAGGLAGRANELLTNVNEIVTERLGQDIHNTLVATQRAMNVLANAPNQPFIQQTTRTLAATERVMARVDSLLGSATTDQRLDSLSANLSALTRNLAGTTMQLDTMLSRMNRGEGSLGRMASDTALYVALRDLSTSLSALLTDLKEHPDRYIKPGVVRVKLF